MNNTNQFIQTIGTLARNEYLSREKWILPSVCIAQAALESGWNLNAATLFGIKGAGVTCTTKEYYKDHYVQIQASFRNYPSVAASVVGYYDFLSKTPRYKKAICNPDYKDAVDKLIHTTDGKAYATDPDYIKKIQSIILKHNLTTWDTRSNKKTVDELAKEVIQGKWGNGEKRIMALYNAGYDVGAVQERVNQLLE